MAHGNVETEIKLRLPDAAHGRRLVEEAGFRVVVARVFEANQLFDTAGLQLRQHTTVLRLREVDGTARLTYKGPPTVGRHKSRDEFEVEIGDARTMQTVLERLGFHGVFRYEKYRTEYRRDEEGIVMLDETPIGEFLELEGPSDWIDRTAKELGFAEADYVTTSYGRLYLEWCAGRSDAPADMIFAGAARQ